MEGRPAEGPGEDEQWTTSRTGADKAPVSSFMASLKGSDAAIELIVGQGRILTTKQPIATENGVAVVAVGDPTVLDFEVLPNPQMIRMTGKRVGVTDFTVVTSEGQSYIFEVHVVYDLPLLEAQLRQIFPDALINLSQMREHVILRGQARTTVQVARIEETLRVFLASVQTPQTVESQQGAAPPEPRSPQYGEPRGQPEDGENGEPGAEAPGEAPFRAGPEAGGRPRTRATYAEPQVINLLRVPGVQQVMLHVRVAELNRTALREIGTDLFYEDGSGNILGTQIGGATVIGPPGGAPTGLTLGTSTTGYGIFPNVRLEIMLRALRENGVVSILAEPNLIAMNGQTASFLAGGEFPVPVQTGLSGAVQVQWKDFGVQLNFVPFILDDESIRLQVAPEVSTIDESLGTTLVVGGDPVPGVNTRRVDTTVELKEGETLVLAGLLSVEMDAQTQRIPGLGDLPYIGPMFSNTSHRRVERELLVLVTPYLVSPLCPEEVPCLPGADIQDPNDLEFYLSGRMEGRRGRMFRSPTAWDDPWHLSALLRLERDHIYGPAGFSE
jgi:pilus assembly protein CpaC